MTPPERFSTEFCLSVTPPLPNIISHRPLIFLPICKYNLISRNFTSPTDIIPLIYQKHILLECLYTKDATVYGTVRVHNLTYAKYIFVRVTEDEWTSYNDIRSWHSINHPDDNTDAFNFQISLGRSFDEAHGPKRLVFVVCLQALSQEYWDNNHNANYVLDALEK